MSATAADAAEYLSTLGDRVRSARVARGLGYREAEAASGISKSVLHNIEHATRSDLRLSTVIRLLDWIASDPRR